MVDPRLVERHAGEVRVLGRHPADGDLGHGGRMRPGIPRGEDEGARERHRADQERDTRGGRDRGDGRESLAALGERLGGPARARVARPQCGDPPDELRRPEAPGHRQVCRQRQRQRRQRQGQGREGEGEQEALGEPEAAAQVTEQCHPRRRQRPQHGRRPELLDPHDASRPGRQALRALSSAVRSSTSTRSATTPCAP